MKNILLLLLGIIVFGSCSNQSIKTSFTDVNGIKLELLFEHDGCKMYRFMDGGRYIYWSDCRGLIEYNYKSGKTTIKQQVITD